MNRLIVTILLVLLLNSCTFNTLPKEYVILIEGDHGEDLSGDVPVRVHAEPPEVIVQSQPSTKCDLFVLPPAPPIPVMPPLNDPENATNLMVAEASMRHIERLQSYILERKIEVRVVYNAYQNSCKR